MATKIYLAVAEEHGMGSMTAIVMETFDQVLNQVYPVSQPSSSLEARTSQLFTLPSGDRTLIHPANIFRIDEGVDPDQEES